MRGIIIAAGLARRMGDLTAGKPKCLLPIGSKTLLDCTVERLYSSGCTEIVIVVGHKSEAISRDDLIRVKNPRYRENNILHSLMCARDYLEGETIITYSDIWVEPFIYESLLSTSGDIVIAADRDWQPYYEGRTEHPVSEAENVVIDDQARVHKIGKHLSETDSVNMLFGEFLGLWRMTSTGTKIFKSTFLDLDKELNDLSPFQKALEWQKAYITDMMQHLVDDGVDVHASVIERGWAELDTQQDFKRLPEIAQRQRLETYLAQLKA